MGGIATQVNLSVPDIEKILDTLIYDGKVERRLQAGGGVQEQLKLYRATQTLLPPVGLVKTPCGICPVPLVTSAHRSAPPHGVVAAAG
ncbi:DNA-directed RNA polymerase III subunit RPC6 [Amphibalanus amphitrite]|uniref:DNA-directed RNA polymerase III subunit RPC6 n=1 Tax=Amphibalanus amphitrite TaxID=1232801 RepID=A0A6A4V348_AMPAM|nr:DNA-directed RNA polymerase III subunit RPC6 [Amphibalanus amphitrite]